MPQFQSIAIPPAGKRIALRVSPPAQRALRRGHPWLFADAITRQSHEGKPGDLAVIFDNKRRFLAIGLYDPHSPIRVRVLHYGQSATLNNDWFKNKIQAALTLRAPLANTGHTTGYRVIHGENDGLPGLVLDRYDKTYVMKLYTTAWLPHLEQILAIILTLIPAKRIVLRMSRTMLNQPEHLYTLKNGHILHGSSVTHPISFQENGLTFMADVVRGQKTGFFFDHRHNRAKVETLAKGKRVLNVFAYTGAFSLYAARGGAKRVMSLDISQPALSAALRNFKHNDDEAIRACRHDLLVGDAFQSLFDLHRSKRSFDMVIVDPPSFAKNQTEVAGALGAYGRLTRLALQVLRPGGVLVMASCTGRVTAEMFADTVQKGIERSGREATPIAQTAHALDHPITFPQGAYLKCLFTRL